MKRNVVIILISVLLYILNQCFKTLYSIEIVKWFMSCYFNDIIGSIAFIAYCNIFIEMHGSYLNNLFYIVSLLFVCGLFWEYVTPLFRSDTVADLFDLIAYMCGGFIYWLIDKK